MPDNLTVEEVEKCFEGAKLIAQDETKFFESLRNHAKLTMRLCIAYAKEMSENLADDIPELKKLKSEWQSALNRMKGE